MGPTSEAGSNDELLASIIAASEEGITAIDVEGRVMAWNPGAERIYGWTAGEMIGHSIKRACPADRVAELDSAVARAAAGERVTFDTQRVRKDGRIVDVTVTIAPLFSSSGRLLGLGGLIRDITEKKRAEVAMRESQYLLEQAQAVAHVGSWVSGVIDASDELSWSAEAYRIFGVPEGAPMDIKTFFACVHEEDRERVRAAARRTVLTDAPYDLEHRIVRPDREIRWVHEKAIVVGGAAGAPTPPIATVQDITGRRRAEQALRRSEEQLRHAQKLEAVGRLAGGVAHDFNNMLSIVLSYASLVMGQLAPGSPIREDLEQIQRAAERAAELTRQLLAFSRQQVLRPTALDLNHVLRGMERMLRRLLGEGIELSIVEAPGLGLVLVDPGQIEQVIVNLATNARDAMPRGGRLTVETANVDLDESTNGEHGGAGPGRYVMLTVSDSGLGMDAATRARVFDPFFTTKGHGEGTGLGLASVFGVVQQSGGHIWVESAPGAGATFRACLPRCDSTVAGVTRHAPSPVLAPGGSETILLVEDEDEVRGMIRTVLKRHGYFVLDARNAGEALLICEQHKEKIHLLLSDVVMPRMSGPELGARLARVHPEMRVLYMSGYAERSIDLRGILDGEGMFLAKPVTPGTLLKKVRAVLVDPRTLGSAASSPARDEAPS